MFVFYFIKKNSITNFKLKIAFLKKNFLLQWVVEICLKNKYNRQINI